MDGLNMIRRAIHALARRDSALDSRSADGGNWGKVPGVRWLALEKVNRASFGEIHFREF